MDAFLGPMMKAAVATIRARVQAVGAAQVADEYAAVLSGILAQLPPDDRALAVEVFARVEVLRERLGAPSGHGV